MFLLFLKSQKTEVRSQKSEVEDRSQKIEVAISPFLPSPLNLSINQNFSLIP